MPLSRGEDVIYADSPQPGLREEIERAVAAPDTDLSPVSRSVVATPRGEPEVDPGAAAVIGGVVEGHCVRQRVRRGFEMAVMFGASEQAAALLPEEPDSVGEKSGFGDGWHGGGVGPELGMIEVAPIQVGGSSAEGGWGPTYGTPRHTPRVAAEEETWCEESAGVILGAVEGHSVRQRLRLAFAMAAAFGASVGDETQSIAASSASPTHWGTLAGLQDEIYMHGRTDPAPGGGSYEEDAGFAVDGSALEIEVPLSLDLAPPPLASPQEVLGFLQSGVRNSLTTPIELLPLHRLQQEILARLHAAFSPTEDPAEGRQGEVTGWERRLWELIRLDHLLHEAEEEALLAARIAEHAHRLSLGPGEEVPASTERLIELLRRVQSDVRNRLHREVDVFPPREVGIGEAGEPVVEDGLSGSSKTEEQEEEWRTSPSKAATTALLTL